uniref:Uncharacterized protein n=1 Tax=Rhizophora mucronata TaxID=61149 RepID=A0A2P2IYC7_RHIMU
MTHSQMISWCYLVKKIMKPVYLS